jgi:hypothetical protein
MAMRPSYDWEPAFTAVILEADRSKLKGRIDAAQAAIDRRLQELGADHGGSPEERVEIANALASLQAFRKRVAMPLDTPPRIQ